MGVGVLSLTSSSPSLIQYKSLQSIWLWRPVGLNCRSLTELGEIQTSFLKGTHKNSHTPSKRSYLIGAWARLTCWTCRVSRRGKRVAVAHPGHVVMSNRYSGAYSAMWRQWLQSWLSSMETWPHPTACRLPTGTPQDKQRRVGTGPYPSADQLPKDWRAHSCI